MINLILGDCLEKLKELDSNSIDSIVTDPPYGLAFMGKKWDYDVPSVEIWKECLRVLKPGGHLLSFGGARTYHRMAVNIEDAGFEIRDQMQWIYGSGFPKSHNLKNEWQGWGTALKPANEPICVARKPLEKGLTIAENVERWGCGAINVDGCRIETSDKINSTTNQNIRGHMIGSGNSERERDTVYSQHPQGRWPANVIFDEEAADMLDEQVKTTMKMHGAGNKKTRTAGDGKQSNSMFGIEAGAPTVHYDHGEDSSKASRFFYVAKASKRERNAGLEGMPKKLGGAISGKETRPDRPPNHTMRENFHPTVKPIKLMEYLIKLVTPPQGTILDPFMGSGSTGVAAKNIGFSFVGCEMNCDYFEIAKKRIEGAPQWTQSLNSSMT